MSCGRSILAFVDRLALAGSRNLGARFALLAQQFPQIAQFRRPRRLTPTALRLCAVGLIPDGCSQGILAPVGAIADVARLILRDVLSIVSLYEPSMSPEAKPFGKVASCKFDDIVSRRLPPGSGPGLSLQPVLKG
jgi:hypothetical protein